MQTKQRKDGFLQTVITSLFILGALAMMPVGVAAGIPSELETIARGDQSRIIAEKDMVLVINTMDELIELYQAIGIDADPSNIDMDKVTVLAAITSPRPSSGFEVEIRGLFSDEKGGFTMAVQETQPSESCDVLTVETRPFHVVVSPLKLDEEPARVNWETMAVACR